MGNLRSVAKALEAAGASVVVTGRRDEIDTADAMCVPGQGIFGRCIGNLEQLSLTGVVKGWIEDRRPYLGICLGMQILFEVSEEGAGVEGLGTLGGKVVRLPPSVRVPHIGWNLAGHHYYYFDHSYAVQPRDDDIVKAWTDHGDRFAAWIGSGPITGVQFHPEKSSAAGIELLTDWVASI